MKTDADVTVIVIYTGATRSFRSIDGPIYSAHNLFLDGEIHDINTTLYTADRPLGVIGCTEQVCRPYHDLSRDKY